MSKLKWEDIQRARATLQLPEQASLKEIKKAYHSLSLLYHPDMLDKQGSDQNKTNKEKMYKITAAYELLVRYCENYRFPLIPDKKSIYDATDWWMDRFGHDPLWGKEKK